MAILQLYVPLYVPRRGDAARAGDDRLGCDRSGSAFRFAMTRARRIGSQRAL
jgi:hypothetical protein